MTALKLRQESLRPETPLQHGRMRRLEERRLEERRKRLRLVACYPARVRWLDARRGAVRHEAILDNLSSNGLYMRVPQKIGAGQKVCVVFRMADVSRKARPVATETRAPAAEAITTEAVTTEVAPTEIATTAESDCTADARCTCETAATGIVRPSSTRSGVPRIAVRGTVSRAELLEDGLWGIVVVFSQHRFL